MREMERANESGARRVLATKRERRGDKDGAYIPSIVSLCALSIPECHSEVDDKVLPVLSSSVTPTSPIQRPVHPGKYLRGNPVSGQCYTRNLLCDKIGSEK